MVDSFRILGMRSEPPETAPGSSVTLDALWADPGGRGRPLAFLWLTCTPPLDRAGDPCTVLTAGPAKLKALPPPCGPAAPGPLCIAGTSPTVDFAVPANALAGGGPGEPNSITVVLILSALPGGVADCLQQWAAAGAPPTDCLVGTKQIRVSTLAPTLQNHNPTVTELDLDGMAVPPSGVTVMPGSTHALSLMYPPSDVELEPAMGADGGTGGMETVDFAWFVTGGTLDHALSGTPMPANSYTAPSATEAVSLWVVVRDDRGGIGWLYRPLGVGGPPPDGGGSD
jgi:hypothetical protein